MQTSLLGAFKFSIVTCSAEILGKMAVGKVRENLFREVQRFIISTNRFSMATVLLI